MYNDGNFGELYYFVKSMAISTGENVFCAAIFYKNFRKNYQHLKKKYTSN